VTRLAPVICLALAACTLSQSGGDDDSPGDGDEKDPGNVDDGPVGRTFRLERTIENRSAGCTESFIEEATGHTVDVSAGSVDVDGMTTGATVDAEPAVRTGQDQPNVQFSVFEPWTVSGAEQVVSVRYELFVAGDLLEGSAETTVAFPAGPCFLDFTVFD
jgi:hypothetical protein